MPTGTRYRATLRTHRNSGSCWWQKVRSNWLHRSWWRVYSLWQALFFSTKIWKRLENEGRIPCIFSKTYARFSFGKSTNPWTNILCSNTFIYQNAVLKTHSGCKTLCMLKAHPRTHSGAWCTLWLKIDSSQFFSCFEVYIFADLEWKELCQHLIPNEQVRVCLQQFFNIFRHYLCMFRRGKNRFFYLSNLNH